MLRLVDMDVDTTMRVPKLNLADDIKIEKREKPLDQSSHKASDSYQCLLVYFMVISGIKSNIQHMIYGIL